MSTQYDAVAASYNELRQHPPSRLVDHNVKIAVEPFIKNAKVLDLACGTGIYTKTLSAWGASQVLGVDISEGMIEVAKSGSIPENVRFQVGDCSKPTIFGSGDYDLIVGAWLLNYASTKEEMTNMYRTIATNLKPGGRFIGITPHPTDDPKAFAVQVAEVRPVKAGEVAIIPKGNVPDGIIIRLVSLLGPTAVEFDGYHLKRSVYETSAREGGLSGDLTWRAIEFPGENVEDPTLKQTTEYWHSYKTVPHFATLVTLKAKCIKLDGSS